MSRCRTPQAQADEFVNANKHFAVTAGSVENPMSPTGVRYKLTNGKWYRLGCAAARLLPVGFPRWGEMG